MSFSIGPFIGKRDAVIQAVRKQLTDNIALGSAGEQAQQAVDYIVAELSKAPDKQTCVAQAWGHSDTHGRYCTIGVNQLPSGAAMIPQLVE